MASARDEIIRAARELGLDSNNCRILPEDEGKSVLEWLEGQCVRAPNRRWWWEVLRDPNASHDFGDSEPYTRLELIAPDPLERVWFVADSDDPGFVVCDTSVANAQRIVGECYGFEYVIGSKDGTWAIGENHHELVWVVGAKAVEGLRRAVQQRDAADGRRR